MYAPRQLTSHSQEKYCLVYKVMDPTTHYKAITWLEGVEIGDILHLKHISQAMPYNSSIWKHSQAQAIQS